MHSYMYITLSLKLSHDRRKAKIPADSHPLDITIISILNFKHLLQPNLPHKWYPHTSPRNLLSISRAETLRV
jgi:hypothetical protein